MQCERCRKRRATHDEPIDHEPETIDGRFCLLATKTLRLCDQCYDRFISAANADYLDELGDEEMEREFPGLAHVNI